MGPAPGRESKGRPQSSQSATDQQTITTEGEIEHGKKDGQVRLVSAEVGNRAGMIAASPAPAPQIPEFIIWPVAELKPGMIVEEGMVVKSVEDLGDGTHAVEYECGYRSVGPYKWFSLQAAQDGF